MNFDFENPNYNIVMTAWLARPKKFKTRHNLEIDIGEYHYPSVEDMEQYINWCKVNAGLYDIDWNFSKVHYAFYFRLREDAIAFKLRFGLR